MDFEDTTKNYPQRPPGFYTSKRFSVAVLMFFGNASLSLCTMNFNIAVVEMTSNDTNIKQSNSNNVKFNWSVTEIAFLISLTFYGNLAAPFAGIFASRYNAKSIFGIGIFITGVFSLLTPFMVKFNFYLFCASRFIVGIIKVFSFKCSPEIWSRWAPPNERAKLTGLSGIGWNFGSMITYPLSGYIAKNYGWPTIFYVTGILPTIWSIIWLILVSNDPTEDKFISETERLHLQKTVNRKLKDKVNFLWKRIFTSKAVWVFLITKQAHDFGQVVINYSLPQYVKDVGKVNVQKIGIISAMPQISAMCGTILAGYSADYVRSSWKLNPTQIHKLYICGGFIFAAVCFSLIPMLNFTEGMVFASLEKCFLNFAGISFNVILLDIAPRYASVLSGLVSFLSFFTCSSATTIVGFIVTHGSASEWNIIFRFISGFYIVSAGIFFIFGTAELQLWSTESMEENQYKLCTEK